MAPTELRPDTPQEGLQRTKAVLVKRRAVQKRSKRYNPRCIVGVLPCPEPILQEEYNTLEADQKAKIMLEVVNKLCAKITEMDVTLNHDSDGLITQLGTVQEQCDKNSEKAGKIKDNMEKIDSISKEIDSVKKSAEVNSADIGKLDNDVTIIKGVLTKHSKQLDFLNEKVAMITARSKKKNITISNPLGDQKDENCHSTVIQFFRGVLEIDVMDTEILIAHRIGRKDKKDKDKNRMMLVRCTPDLKSRIFENISNLKDKKNEKDMPYYINKQLPDMFVEQKRENREIIAAVKKKEKSLPVNQKTTIEIRDHKVFLGDQLAPKHLPRVEINELFPTKSEKEKQAQIIFTSSDVVGDRMSTFQSFAAITRNIHEVRRAYHKIRSLHPGADHVVAMYVNNQHIGYQDDMEYGAGHKLVKHVQEQFPNMKQIAVFMVRTFGGIKLGPDRYTHMKNTVTEALNRLADK